MPTYEFQCQKCSLEFRKSLPFGSKDIPVCPKCHGSTKKMIRPPMVVFKGAGFYKTDSAKPASASSEQKQPPSESKPADAKPESTPEPKPEPKKETPKPTS